MSATYKPIAFKQLTSPITTIEFTNIPANFRHIEVLASVKSSASGVNAGFRAVFNDDTTASYSIAETSNDGSNYGSGGGSSSTNAYLGGLYTNAHSSSYFTAFYSRIYDYSAANVFKFWESSGGTIISDIRTNFIGGHWRKNDAINKITFSETGSNTFQTGSTIHLYGIAG